jgi:hypothetical protein
MTLPFDDITISALQATMVIALDKYPDETPLSPNVPDGRKLGILMSEVGEVADAMIANHHNKELMTELIQTAAMALAWAQSLEQDL